MLEILVALVFVSFAFLPIYNMFRFGTRGTTSNTREAEATNYASDLINFMRDRKATELKNVFKKKAGKPETLDKDDDIIAALNKMCNPPGSLPVVPPIEEKGYVRSMTVTQYTAENKKGIFGVAGWFSDSWKRRGQVMNYLISVRVAYAKPGSSDFDDEVVLYTIVMD